MGADTIDRNARIVFILAPEPSTFAGPLRLNITKWARPVQSGSALDADTTRDHQSGRQATCCSSRRENDDCAAMGRSGVQGFLSIQAIIDNPVADDIV